MKNAEQVILFDGVCVLCNSFVNFIIKHDHKRVFKFAALQGNYAKALEKKYEINTSGSGTVLFFSDGKIYKRSEAALQILKRMQFPFYIAYFFIIVPSFIRDAVYNFISRNRYSWFGKLDACRLPLAGEEMLFLD